ncbi:MAG: PIN domain-containing protein [Thermoplasmata archaeon]|nr:PIN domain-containing protein [Candidatus Sysuiplasma acidicola]
MAHAFGNERYLALDTNVLVQFLISDAPGNESLRFLETVTHLTCPTVLHEAYHTCVFKLHLNPAETAGILKKYAEESMVVPIDMETSMAGLDVAAMHNMGGRDALIIASYASAGRFFPNLGSHITVLSLDRDLLRLKKLSISGTTITLLSPHSYRSS